MSAQVAAPHSVLFDAPGPKMRRTIGFVNLGGGLVILAIIAWAGWRLDQVGQLSAYRWSVVIERDTWVYYLLPGLLHTLEAAAIAVVGAILFGLVFGVGRLSQNALVRLVTGAVVEFFRAVPVLLMMIFLWYFLPGIYSGLGWVHPPDPSFVAVVIALILYNGSVCADLIRTGVHNLPSGQGEAAAAIGLTPRQALSSVLVPQALLAMLPALIAQLVVALKDSALGQIIAYSELLNEAVLRGGIIRVLPSLVVAAAMFIIINYTLGKLGEYVGSRMRSRTSQLDPETAEDLPMNVTAKAAATIIESVDQDGYSQAEWRDEPWQDWRGDPLRSHLRLGPEKTDAN
ncbi:MAG: amino acid ABC transporter permease [Propionibacteriaceae bacterium]|nr:amino acid ABC transporter permease [Propionibacteriaceae bacterium]